MGQSVVKTMEIADYNEIIPGLFVGNQHTRDFCGDDVSLVVNCTQKVGAIPDKKTIHLKVGDAMNQATLLYELLVEENVLAKIHRALTDGGQVLVHCRVGMSRSCSVVACYLVKYHGMTTDEAIRFIRAKRTIAFEQGINFRDTIERIEEDNKIDDAPDDWAFRNSPSLDDNNAENEL